MSEIKELSPNRFRPENIDELSELVQTAKKPMVFGLGKEPQIGHPTLFRERARRVAHRVHEFLNSSPPTDELRNKIHQIEAEEFEEFIRIELELFEGIFEFEPKDMVVKVGANTTIDAQEFTDEDGTRWGITEGSLQHALMREGQCLPFSYPILTAGFGPVMNRSGSLVRRGIALDTPHPLQSQCGSWRDWVLGMTMVLADGSIVKAGSNVVKNVAGFDVHKLMIGARDTLAIVVDVTLRTFPLDALPEADVIIGPAWSNEKLRSIVFSHEWIQRVRPTDYVEAVASAGKNLLFADNASSTIWCWLDSPEPGLPRYSGDWVMRTGCGDKNISITDPTQIALMKRAKAIFDPTNKLNPGEFGFL